MNIASHIHAKVEPVGFIKNGIKTIKERSHEICHDAPYKRYSSLMTQSLVEGVVDLLNLFPSKNKISGQMPPAMIMEGKNRFE